MSQCIKMGNRFPIVLRYEVSDGKFQMVSFFRRPNFPCIDFPMSKKFLRSILPILAFLS